MVNRNPEDGAVSICEKTVLQLDNFLGTIIVLMRLAEGEYAVLVN